MWISRKKFQNIEKRIADLEKKVRSQQKEITSLNYPYEDVKQKIIPETRSERKHGTCIAMVGPIVSDLPEKE